MIEAGVVLGPLVVYCVGLSGEVQQQQLIAWQVLHHLLQQRQILSVAVENVLNQDEYSLRLASDLRNELVANGRVVVDYEEVAAVIGRLLGRIVHVLADGGSAQPHDGSLI